MTDTNPTTTDQYERDPGQLVLPRVDTSPEVLGPLTLDDVKALAPAAGSGFVGAAGLVAGDLATASLGAAGVGAFGLTAAGMRATDRWYTTPRDRVAAWARHLRRDTGDDLDVLPDVNGVDALTADGTLCMADGRYVALVRIEPRNTAMLDTDQRREVVAALSTAIDEQIRDQPFRLFSTTRPASIEDVADRYEDRGWEPDLTDAQSDLLFDIADWLREEDAPSWDAREWHHYLAIEADARAVQGNDSPGVLAMMNPLAESGNGAVPDEQIRARLRDRVETAVGAIGSVPGLAAELAHPRETLAVVRQQWGRTGPLPSGLTADLEGGEIDVRNVTAPETFAPRKGWVDLGEEYARTMWVAEYAREPACLWLKPLTTLRGVDVSLTVNADPVPVDDATFELAQQYADVGSEQADREAEGDASAHDAATATDATVRMRSLLRETPSRPWQVSTYVTVRVRDEDALAAAEDALAQFDSLDSGKYAALHDRSETVRDVLSQSPANATLLTPGVTQEQAFRAASPLTGDEWDAETRAPKTRLVPGAVIGSMFPFAAADRRESDGMDWGRNTENGTHLRLSPFRRGGAPHMLTIGQSRSGKTYAATKAALRWFLERDDRTLIVCDTQRGFDGLTDICDGEHIEIDTGAQSVNPLRIEPPAEDGRAEEEFRLTVEETVGFVLGLLRADGVENAGQFAPLLSQAAERTLVDTGDIDKTRPQTFAGADADLRDLLETLVAMNEQPDRYTWSGQGVEGEIHEQQVGELLTRLRSFQSGGKYEGLVGGDELGLVDQDVRMAYLDMHALAGSADAEKSAMLQLMLSQVREKIKQAPGETVFLLDEAHVLLDNDRTADWLQKAAREFARYDACLWYLSQSPQDFVSGANESAARDTIREQCSMTHVFRVPGVSDAVLERFELNAPQREFVKAKAVRGKAGRGYSECLINATDIEGWLPCYVEASPTEHDAIVGDDP